jgi:hypothetical protein
MDDATRDKLKQLAKDMERFVRVGDGDREQRPLMAQIHVIVADEQAKSAERVERQTDKLICLTWALVGLTAVLLLFTAYLCYDIYQHRHHDALNHQSTTEQR